METEEKGGNMWNKGRMDLKEEKEEEEVKEETKKGRFNLNAKVV